MTSRLTSSSCRSQSSSFRASGYDFHCCIGSLRANSRCIQVAYGDKEADAPNDRVREVSNQSDNMNHGFWGKCVPSSYLPCREVLVHINLLYRHVWLVPEYTFETPTAATSFDIHIQNSVHPEKDDLAKGALGRYRHLVPIPNERQTLKIVEVKLLRSIRKLARAVEAVTKVADFDNLGDAKEFVRSGGAVDPSSIPERLGPGW